MTGYPCVDVVILVLVTAFGWKPFGTVSEVVLAFDDQVINTLTRQCYVRRVGVHFAVLEQRSFDISVNEIVVELQHAEFGVLVDEEADV